MTILEDEFNACPPSDHRDRPMRRIAFLVGDTRIARNDNHLRLPRAFTEAGWEVSELPQEIVRLEPRGVRLGETSPAHFDLIWLLGLGRAETFFDRMQLLRQLPQEQFVTRVDALVYLHAKYGWWRHMPETHASNDPQHLNAVVQQGGEWVVKPGAGSYGRDVVRVSPGHDAAAAIERMTAGGRYCLLQRFVPQVASGETRTLVAGGRIIGSYLRVAEADFRTNLAQGASARPTTLEAGERRLVEAVAEELLREGIGFAAVDTVYPYLIEVNLANPGGLGTLADLYGRDFSGDVVAAIAAALPAGGADCG
jgi:glutathione synthase